MRSLLAFSCVLLTAADVVAQFEILSQERTLAAHAAFWYPGGLPLGSQTAAETHSFAADAMVRFNRSAVASPCLAPPLCGVAVAEAFQDSILGEGEIVLVGGVPRVSAHGYPSFTLEASARSEAEVVFVLSEATDVALTFVRVDSGVLTSPFAGPEPVAFSADAGFSLFGPSFAYAVTANTATHPFGSPDAQPLVGDLRFELAPGEYTLTAFAVGEWLPNVTLAPASYDIRLAALPMPEPASWVAALLVVGFLVARRLRHRA